MKFEKILNVTLKPHNIFLAISFIFGLIFILINPPLWGLDEPAHFVRAYQVAEGEMLPNTSDDNFGGSVSKNFYAIAKYRDADILDGKFNSGYGVLHRQDITDKLAYNHILGQKFSDNKQNFHWTAMYSPITYPGPTAGIYIAKSLNLNIGHTLFIARFFSLLSFIAICFIAIWVVRNMKVVWLFVVAALLPTMVFQATIVSSDTLLLSLSLLFFSVLTRLLVVKDKQNVRKWLISCLVLIGVMLPLIKINFIFISLLIAVLPNSYFKSIKWAILFKAITVLFFTSVALIWSKISGATNAPPLSQRPDQLPVDPAAQIHFAISHPIEFIVAMAKSIVIYGDSLFNGVFFTVSGNGVGLPILLTIILMLTLVLSAVYARSELIKMKRYLWVAVIASIIAAVSICGALYAVFNPVGWWFIDGLQGRYFTPFVLPIIMLLSLYIPFKVSIREKIIKNMVYICVVACLTVAVAYLYLAYY